MGYRTLTSCLDDLESHGHLVRIKEEVSPDLEMAAIHLRVHSVEGPAVLYEKVNGSPFPAVSNLFGTLERSRFIFKDTLEKVKKIIALKNNPFAALKSPLKYLLAI